jgi:hypothetical protein
METRTRKFEEVFSLRIVHAYFAGGICPYISLEPDMECLRLFVKRRLICRQYPGELKVIGEIDEGSLVAGSKQKIVFGVSEEDHFLFNIRMDDPAFLAVTKLDLTDFSTQRLYYSNTAKSPKLSVKKYNPGRNGEASLGVVDISSISNKLPEKGPRDAFLLSFEAGNGFNYL